MESIIKELWHGNIIPHHEDLEKRFTNERYKAHVPYVKIEEGRRQSPPFPF